MELGGQERERTGQWPCLWRMEEKKNLSLESGTVSCWPPVESYLAQQNSIRAQHRLNGLVLTGCQPEWLSVVPSGV